MPRANFGSFFDVALEPEEIRGSFSYKSFFFHLGLPEKHIIFKIGDRFFGLCTPRRKTALLTWPGTTRTTWRPIFWENVHPIGANFPQNMGLQLPPVRSGRFNMCNEKKKLTNSTHTYRG